MKYRNKNNKLKYLFILLLAITIGYAALSTTLKINGSTTIGKNTWKIYWHNVANEAGVTAEDSPDIGDDDTNGEDTVVTWGVTLTTPGDYYEFTVDAVNEGGIDAMVTDISTMVTDSTDTVVDLPSYVKFTVTYDNGRPIIKKHILPKANGNTPTRVTYKVRVEYLKSITNEQLAAIGEDGVEYNFSFEVQYGQADDTAVPLPTSFQEDSWAVIAANVNADKSIYDIGDTKTFEMNLVGDDDENETYTLKVVNNTTPDQCTNIVYGLSQSACGFVVELQGINSSRSINATNNDATTNGDGNKGGWKYSQLRAYLNGEVYREDLEGETDYAGSGLIDKLPSGLKHIIIPTKVISGHGSNDNSNFESEDYIYIASTREIWLEGSTSNVPISTKDSAYYQTRQLDYYHNLSVTTSNYEAVSRTGVSGPWALRSAVSDVTNAFILVYPQGYPNYTLPTSSSKYFPLFRFAE